MQPSAFSSNSGTRRARRSSGKRCVMTPFGVDAARADVLEQVRHVALHVALGHPQREPLVHRDADRHQVRRAARTRRRSRRCRPCAPRRCAQSSTVGGARRSFSFTPEQRLQRASPPPRSPTASMHTSGPRPPVSSLSATTGSRTSLEVDRLAPARTLARTPSRSVDPVDARSPAPRRAARRASPRTRPDRPAAEHRHRVARPDLAHLRRLVAGRQDVGEEEHVLVVHVVRDLHRPDVGERARARTRPARRRSRRWCASSRTRRRGQSLTGSTSRSRRAARAGSRSRCRRRC